MTDKKKLGRNEKDSNDDMINLVDNVNRVEDLKYNRRAFLKTAVGASVALGVATIPFSVRAVLGFDEDEKERVEIAKMEDLPKGSSKTFYYPEDEAALLVHTANGDLVAYNSSCTHLMCPVTYEKEKDILLCPCHKGYFDINTGHPVAGPPQRELPLIEIEVENGVVYAVGRKFRHG
ncbi:ubiquinol-cytochrome c reductase iron-sulfur subunit [Desertibacillus haloalkaliphilus]|uniref:QcrA and Rieske domain-containing protein n=1 Tax=Desertibacillus haloalkaliphilus TaxID=1328930 RepID=UPI001C261F3C|nr:Rieske 2Fe-2S domain-containing protein [Desertibacillus haloalkaliphilus]MBU8908320.1 Rieske 2Fe-2S domain-containing protein [Desertibacillus haloalkaliphilus]